MNYSFNCPQTTFESTLGVILRHLEFVLYDQTQRVDKPVITQNALAIPEVYVKLAIGIDKAINIKHLPPIR